MEKFNLEALNSISYEILQKFVREIVVGDSFAGGYWYSGFSGSALLPDGKIVVLEVSRHFVHSWDHHSETTAATQEWVNNLPIGSELFFYNSSASGITQEHFIRHPLGWILLDAQFSDRQNPEMDYVDGLLNN
jgi:hypothetical protein